MDIKQIALKVHQDDNVATLFLTAQAGDIAPVQDKHGNINPVRVNQNIPYGHKIALRDIACGEQIIKYGEAIGVSTQDIRLGDYVHTHNLDSERGRGDKA